MKKVYVGMLITAALMITTFAFVTVYWHANMPIVYIRAASGRCAAVFVVDAEGKRVRKPCLKSYLQGRYRPVFVSEKWEEVKA